MPLADHQFLDRLPADLAHEHANGRAGEMSPAVRARLKFLRPEDRTLVEMVTIQRVPIRQIGRLIQKDAGSLTRRLQRLGAALHDPFVRAVTDERCPLPAEHRQLVIEHLLQFRKTTELADLHQMSSHAVKAMLAYARGWFNGYQSHLHAPRNGSGSREEA